MSENFQEELNIAFNELKNQVKKPNILLVGGTGVGKSSLLNLCFDNDLAAVGVGKPVTKYISKFHKQNIPIVLFDSKGYEIGKEQELEFQQEVVDLCTVAQGNVADKPHLVWYCIQAIGARITDFDIEIIKNIELSGVPIAIILTKSDLVSEGDAELLKNVIASEFPTLKIFETSIKEKLKGMDLEKLIAWSIAKLPDALKIAFVSAQKGSLKEKREFANTAITQHTSLAFATGFTPIPAASAPLLLANQSKLLARILYIYNLDRALDNVSAIIQVAIASALPVAGKYLVSQVLKFIPGVGTLLGGTINGTVAATITSAFGFAVSEACSRIVEMGLDNFDNKEFQANFDESLMQIFMEYLKQAQGTK
ncbi:50S ribosome-binding GTPase [Wohlfahrtiimonas chitiniclastica]|uniref:GTPase n=1 Tax=Wohlfahrtiimonas chitiniclastica TaxID=400946 RepID=UPI0007B404F2|nr:GTPase [Wohlfahrtiimonas chitiniclastica]KZS22828.1 hypothetical protein BMY_0658 [Wohlfahrtiimonas chitiniclastica]MDC7252932.1 GTPase [Wohlfahrtiimonas chitiniclastica]WHR55275.1 50S ribosome-binding GTPase [Wohlfahrtiimonas chitiniclastica]